VPLDLSRIKALCFDVDGTLSDTDDQWVQRMEKLLHPLRGLFPGGQTRPFCRWTVMGMETPGNLVYHALDRVGLDDEVGRLFNLMAKARSHRPSHAFMLIPGVDGALKRLFGRFPMCVVSARDEGSTLSFLEQYSLRSMFVPVVTSQTCAYTKPFPHPVLWAAEQMGVPASQCLMIGDTTVDIRAGKAAGAQTVGVLCGFGNRKELERAGADLVLECTADLADVLLGVQPEMQ